MIEIKKLNYLKYSNILVFGIVFLLIVWIIKLYSPLIIGADTMFHYNRLYLMIEALQSGSYPVYMDYASTNGYGYLVNTFYPDIVLLPFALIGLFTSLHTAYISLIVTSSMLIAIFTYWCTNTIYKNKFTAYIATILYTFAIYRWFDLFYRGAVAEYLAFTFIPLILLGIYQITNGDYKKWYILSIAMFLLLNTHLITASIVVIILSIYLIVNYKQFIDNNKRFYYLLLSIAVSILLSMNFLLPFGEQIFSNKFYFSSNPATSIEYSLLTFNKLMQALFNNIALENEIAVAPKIGALLFGLLFVRLAIKEKNKQLKYIDISVIIGIMMVAMSNHYFPWNYLPFKYLSFIQHPTRLFMFASFIFAIAAAYYLANVIKDNKRQKLTIVVLFIVISLIAKSDSYSYHQIFKNHGILDNKIEHNLTLGGAEYLPEKIKDKDKLWKTDRNLVYDKENISIINYKKKDAYISFDVQNINSLDSIIIPFVYYKGYEIKSNNLNINYSQSKEGLIKIEVEKESNIVIRYTGTTIQSIANWISVIGILSLIIYLLILQLKNKRYE